MEDNLILTAPSTGAVRSGARDNRTRRAVAYLAKLPPAIAGQGGHKATFAAACRAVEFGLDRTEALAVLAQWNVTHCQPPWSESELRHKLEDAFRTATPRPALVTAPAGQPPRRVPTAPLAAAGKRLRIPPVRPGSPADFAALAARRCLAVEGLMLASARGLLRFGDFRGHPAWFILDGSHRVAQARRLDGLPWAEGVKAWTLAGGQATWPVGVGESEPFPVVAFCEGGPDLLAAHAFILAEGREADCAAVAMLGAAARIHPEALPVFAGRTVRLFPHADDTGAEATDRWSDLLQAAGATVDAFAFDGLRRVDGAPVKDLNDLAAVHADDFEAHRCVWSLFP